MLANPGARFIAGGTNLLDLMKLQIETPGHLIDVNPLALDKFEPTPDGSLRIGALARIPNSPQTNACGAITASCHAPCCQVLQVSCATRRPRPVICSSARAFRIFMTPIRPATNASAAQVAALLAA